MKALHKTLFLLCLSSSIAGAQTTVTYTYDELGRVKSATDSVNGDRAYDYDPAGNRKTVIVNAVGNNPPVAKNDSVRVYPLYTTFTFNLLSNDSDPNGDALTVVSHTQPSNASVSLSGNSFKITGYYSPAGSSFTYTISDGKGGLSTATVSVSTAP